MPRTYHTYLDVVVRELAMLVIIHTEKLSLLRGTELQAGNHVDGLGDDGRHNKGVGAAGHNVSDLDVEKLVVLVEEAAGDASVDTIQADDVIGSEEGVEDQTDNAADSVFSEHIEGVVNANEELELGAKIASNAGDNTESNAGPWGDETGGRSGGDETRDSAGTPADERPLLGEAVIEQAPSHGGKHGSQARVPASHGSAEVGAESRATVEAEPAEPEEDGAKSNERNVVRAEVKHHLLVTPTEDPGVGES